MYVHAFRILKEQSASLNYLSIRMLPNSVLNQTVDDVTFQSIC